MASIFAFCDLSEFRNWIVELGQHYGLGIVYFSRTTEGAKTVAPENFLLEEDIYWIYLVPPGAPSVESLNDVRQREWGWIPIRPGGLKKHDSRTCLLLSEMHGERSDVQSGNPEKWVLWLKRKIKPKVRVGVVGTNVVYGGSQTYKDIWYTEKAEEMFKSGVIWKQYVDDNAIYEPLP